METLQIVEVGNKYGKMLIYAGEQELVAYKKRIEIIDHEKYLSDELETGIYDIFLDVGAEFGYFSRIASKHCKLVYSFEAHPIRYGFLLWNTRDLANIRVIQAYVGTKESDACISDRYWEMVCSKDRLIKHEVPYSSLNEVSKIELDEVLSFDLKIFSSRVLIKIDVEGNELDVLSSASKLLSMKNITWAIELHDGIDEADLKKFFIGKNCEFMPEPSGTLRNYKFN